MMVEWLINPRGLYLQHPSVFSKKVVSAYERYELLGDKLLGLCMTEILLESYPEYPEGQLSRMVNMLVSKKILSVISQQLSVPSLFNYKLRELSDSIQASMCEVIIAALYYEHGFEKVYAFVRRNWQKWIQEPSSIPSDYKTLLQEFVVRQGYALPVYRVLKQEGPDHARVFTVRVTVDGIGSGEGRGGSKRLAEEDSVKHLCEQGSIEL